MKLDAEGFAIGNGMQLIDEGGLMDLLFERAETDKWFLIFFPSEGFFPIYNGIENQFYTPGSDTNKGYEISWIHDQYTTLVMCYKKWMSAKELNNLIVSVSKQHDVKIADFEIPEGKDLIYIQIKNEDKFIGAIRFKFYTDFLGYYNLKLKEKSNLK